jgi:suppressor of ftsI
MKKLLAAAALCLSGCFSSNGTAPAEEDTTFTRSVEGLEEATPPKTIDAKDGDTVVLTAGPVKKFLRGREVRMLAYNGSVPGPLIRAPQGAEITVLLRNRLGFATTLHSHGVRLDYRYDGSTTVQSPVSDGGQFAYQVKFPDAGIFWYHSHVREDYAQQMGLYGEYLVKPSDSAYWRPVDREVALIIQDVLVDSGGVAATDTRHADHAMMGRFGNVFLVNGDTAFNLAVKRKEVVRFYVTNACNARVLNLGFLNEMIKVVGSDNGAFDEPHWTEYELVAPGERLIFEARFSDTGSEQLTHAIMPTGKPPDFLGIGTVSTLSDTVSTPYGDDMYVYTPSLQTRKSIDSLKPWFDRAPDKTILLTARMGGMGHGHMAMKAAAAKDGPGGKGIEWEDNMGAMNSEMTSDSMTWIIRDSATGLENHQISWSFKRGDKIVIRVFNDSTGMHPMPHPIHFHGQRFLVLRENGIVPYYRGWKDTYLVPRGFTVDLLLDASNPGEWMAHCHIAEHLESSMMLHFRVE